MSERVTIRSDNFVATVMLSRPEKRNAVDAAMFEALADAGRVLCRDRSVRAVVLHGEGEHFCAGIDVSVFAGQGIGAVGRNLMVAEDGSPANFFQRVAWIWQEVPVPVVAALHGAVFGAGLQIALGADIRFAAPTAQLSIMEIEWGIMPDMAISATALHLLPIDRLKELALTGRIIDGREAAETGLVTGLADEPLDAAHALARDIAGRSPDAIRAIKALINDAWRRDTAAALKREAELQSALMGGRNQMEAAAARMQKRTPEFSDAES